MIVVIGSPIFRLGGAPPPGGSGSAAGGLAVEVALAAAAAGAPVQLVGKVGDDDRGDAILVSLAAAGVSHAATLRDPSHATPTWTAPTTDEPDAEEPLLADESEGPVPAVPAGAPGLPLDAGDVELGLRYLTDFRVVVLAADLDDATISVALDAAAYVGAHVIRFDAGAGDAAAAAAAAAEKGGPQVTVLAPPAAATGAFATLIGRYAAGLDGGEPPDRAFRDAVRATDWEPAAD